MLISKNPGVHRGSLLGLLALALPVGFLLAGIRAIHQVGVINTDFQRPPAGFTTQQLGRHLLGDSDVGLSLLLTMHAANFWINAPAISTLLARFRAIQAARTHLMIALAAHLTACITHVTRPCRYCKIW